MMKKILYISFVDYLDPTELGVIKKIEGQKYAFAKFGFEVHHIYYRKGTIFLNDSVIGTIDGPMKKYISQPNYIVSALRGQSLHYDVIYMRYRMMPPNFAKIFKYLRSHSDKIYIEYPTYPYQVEMRQHKLIKSLMIWLDWLTHKKIAPLITNAVTTQDFWTINGVQTLRISNGYSFSAQNLGFSLKTVGNVFNLIMVANFAMWHGADRAIRGIAEYLREEIDSKVKVLLHLVGGGHEIENLKVLVNELNLQDFVVFHGFKSGEALNELYNQSHIGLGLLGLHRVGMSSRSALKVFEYMDFGLPFVIAHDDLELTAYDFVYELPSDDTPLPIFSLLQWYSRISSSPQQIKDVGVRNYSWETQIETIIS
ncbi:glycosyltransferase [Olivibacter sp. XZL3]|uniref:glycosyltransferase n=1 Tax=Olivibacter sp. XZL3 TaxID=1735116 RepID=UPI001066F03E|nr:glycosyltransferase [Olivibacter sp. XZL3]